MKRDKTPIDITGKRSKSRSVFPKSWVLRDPETLNLTFQTFEDLTTLRQRCREQVTDAREVEHMFGSLLWREDESGLQRWSRLSEMITTIWRLLDHTIRTNRLDPPQFQEAYRQMLWIKTVWTRLDPQPGSRRLIDQITDHLRQLLIHSAQSNRHR